MTNKRIHAYVLLLITSIIWGVAGPIIKYTLGYFPPVIFLFYRFAISAGLALIFFAARPKTLPQKQEHWMHVILQGFLTITLGLTLLFFGFDQTSSVTGSLLSAIGPIFCTLFGALLLREHVTRAERTGLLIALFGTAITVISSDGSSIHPAQFIAQTALVGNGLIVISRVIDAIGVVYSKRALQDKVSPVALSNLTFLIGFFSLGILAMLMYPPHIIFNTIFQAPLSAHLGVLYMAILSGSLGYALFYAATKDIDIGQSAIFSYLTIIWAIPVGILWLHERVSPQFIVGAVVIAIGVAIAEYRKRKKRKKKRK